MPAPKFCQNCGFCNRSKLPRPSHTAFVRLIVCVWFPTFCRINGNFIVTDWAEIERSQKSDGTQSFPTNIDKSKISHCTIESKMPILEIFENSLITDLNQECADLISFTITIYQAEEDCHGQYEYEHKAPQSVWVRSPSESMRQPFLRVILASVFLQQ